MEDHLRPAVCYWHTFAWPGSDVFGAGTFDRPWFRTKSPIEAAELKLKVAFEFFEKLGIPFFTFHDRDIAPEGATLKESNAILDRIIEQTQAEMSRTGVKLLWGTANLFSNPRFMSRRCHEPRSRGLRLRGRAGPQHPRHHAQARRRELRALGRSRRLRDAPQHRPHVASRISSGASSRWSPSTSTRSASRARSSSSRSRRSPPSTSTTSTPRRCTRSSQRYRLENEYKVNIEANHAILSGHSFQHEVAYAYANGVFGSLDINRGDSLLGWDTDQFPNDVAETALVLSTFLQNGGFTTGGMNFDAKLRRQSIDAEDLFHAHIGGLDTLARGLLIADKMVQDEKLNAHVEQRYAGWKGELGQQILGGKVSLADLSDKVLSSGIEPKPRSGRQEFLENLVNKYL